MSAPAAIGVNDDFSPSETRIALRTADDELARWADVQMRVVPEERDCRLAILQNDLLQGCLDDIFHNCLVHVCHAWRGHLWTGVSRTFLTAHGLQWLGMLGGDEDRVDLLRLDRTIKLL